MIAWVRIFTALESALTPTAYYEASANPGQKPPRTMYATLGIYSPFFSLQNAVCFIILTYLVPVLFTVYIQDVLKLKK